MVRKERGVQEGDHGESGRRVFHASLGEAIMLKR